MIHPAPSRPDDQLFECLRCGTRVDGDRPGVCSDCGGRLKNISVPRE